MKYVSELSFAEINTLQDMHRNHPIHRVRVRAHALILSNNGYAIKDIADICDMTRQTVSSLTDRWSEKGIAGLYDAPRSGRHCILSPEDEEFVHELTDQHPRSLNIIIATLEDQRGKKVSRSTVRRVIKKKKVWKRIRKSLKSRRDEDKFRKAQERLAELEERRISGEIDIVYSDESGFNMVPCVPYAWQPKGECIEVPASKSRNLNVAGFMNKDNELTPFVFETGIDADTVIACFDSFCRTITGKTFVLTDNSPLHRSKKFISRIASWCKEGLIVKYLPAYSPELNLIEILWRKIKYEWMPFSAYISLKKFAECLDNILVNFGSQYVIEFN